MSHAWVTFWFYCLSWLILLFMDIISRGWLLFFIEDLAFMYNVKVYSLQISVRCWNHTVVNFKLMPTETVVQGGKCFICRNVTICYPAILGMIIVLEWAWRIICHVQSMTYFFCNIHKFLGYHVDVSLQLFPKDRNLLGLVTVRSCPQVP
jgi:hypothetical protein